MPADHSVPAHSGPATGTTSSGRSPRPAGSGLPLAAVVLLAVPLAAALWLLAVAEDRARRRAGRCAPVPCCGECLC